MHDHFPILLTRLERTNRERIAPSATTTVLTPTLARWDVTDPAQAPATPTHPRTVTVGQGEPVSFAQASQASFTTAQVGETWGPAWGTTWWRVTFTLPDEVASDSGACVELHVDLGWQQHSPGFQCEALVYDQQGNIIKALNPFNQWVPVPVQAGEQVFYVEASSVPLLLGVPPFIPTEQGRKTTAGPEPIYRLAKAKVVLVDPATRSFSNQLDALTQLAKVLGQGNARAWQIVTQASAALDKIDIATTDSVRASIRSTSAEGPQALLGALATPVGAKDSAEQTMWAVGHAHIDSAWLWPLRETRRKVARTLANVTDLLEAGQDFVFALPAAQHLAWLEQDHPKLFNKVQHWVKVGKIEPVGGMWVEPDAVLPSGESFCRQFLEGQSFFKEKFGSECEQMWLPDSFGYAGSLPQIATLAGAKAFLTQKISWNQVDKFPHHTFWWEGIDGTHIFTHFAPADTYGAQLSAQELEHARDNFQDKGRAAVSMIPFGYGDGGGGPTREMIERGHFYSNIEGTPALRFGKVVDFFNTAKQDYPQAPNWLGELYLELHRAVFTTQANVKRINRVVEQALRRTELLCATAHVRCGFPWPGQELQELWRELCLYQFHDILPGTSIGWVYDEVAHRGSTMLEQLEQISLNALNTLAQNVGIGQGQALLNTAPQQLPTGFGILKQGEIVFNGVSTGQGPLSQNLPTPAPAKANSSCDDTSAQVRHTPDGNTILSNRDVWVKIDSRGLVTELRAIKDGKPGRNAVAPGLALGTLRLYQDFPNMWDAWDLDKFYEGSGVCLHDLAGQRLGTEPAQDQEWPHGLGVQISAVEVRQGSSDPTRGGSQDNQVEVRTNVSFGNSVVELTWILGPTGTLRLRIDARWEETEKLLKVAFPLDVLTQRAAFETAYGHVWRPVHTNTSWDAYRFEVCAHRWLYAEEPGFGVGIANSRTYGWSLRRCGQQINLDGDPAMGGAYLDVAASLLRSPRYPDPVTDHGQHTFEFAITPQTDLAGAMLGGYALNERPYLLSLPGAEPENIDTTTDSDTQTTPMGRVVPALVQASEQVIVESVKMAADGSQDLIIRCYEPLGTRGQAQVTLPDFNQLAAVDILERPLPDEATRQLDLQPVQTEETDGHLSLGGTWTFHVRPFQIVTLRASR